MKMSSPNRRRFEGSPVAQHRPQDVDPPAGEGDQGLSVFLAFPPLAVVEGSRLGRAAETSESGLVEDPFEQFVPAAHPFVVANPFAGVVGRRHQPGVGCEPVRVLEGGKVSCGHQELRPEDRTHPRQAIEDRRLRTGEKTLLKLLVDAIDPVLESEHLFGQLGDYGGGDAFCGQGDTLGLGRGEGLARDAVGTLDTAVSEVGGETLAAHPTDLRRSLVVGDKRQRSLPIEVQRPLQGREQRQERLFEADDGPAPVGYKVASAGEKELQLREFPFVGPEFAEVGPHAGLIGDDVGIAGISLGFSAVSVAGAVHGEAGDVEDSLAPLPQQRQQKRRAASGLVGRPHYISGEREDLVEESREVGLVVFDSAGEKLCSRGVQYVDPMELLARIHTHPRVGDLAFVAHHRHLRRRGLHAPLEDSADGSLRSEFPSPISMSGRSLLLWETEGRFQTSHLQRQSYESHPRPPWASSRLCAWTTPTMVGSYEQTEHFVNDSIVLRQFCRLYLEGAPDDTTLIRWANTIGARTLAALNDRAVELAQSLKVTRGRKLRTDGTVVETNIHHPTDDTLLSDGVRIISRLIGRAKELIPEGMRRAAARGEPFRNRTRSAKRLAHKISKMARRRTQQAKASYLEAYERLIKIAKATIRQAGRVGSMLEEAPSAGKKISEELSHFAGLLERVVSQARRRVLEGERVAATEKLVSIFEEHTAIIRRGKAPNRTEFGRKVWLSEVDGGIVSGFWILEGNPGDEAQLKEALKDHLRQFGRAPELVAADRNVHSKEN